jgi:ParB family transcriptional regulator, chromosome partitioning protein
MRKFLRKPLSWAKAPDNVRRSLGTEEELIALGNSYKKRPIHPLIAKLDGTTLDGWRRVNGLLRIGETEAEFLVTDEDLPPEEIVQIGLITAMHRQSLSDSEVYQGCKKLMQLHPHWLRKDLAGALDLDPPKVTKILAVDDLIAEVQEAFLVGKFGFSVAYPISKLPAEQQASALAAKLNGGTRDDLERQVKRTKNGTKPTVRVSRVKCSMPSGVCVTFVGAKEGLSLDDLLNTVIDLTKEIRKANDQGLDSKTFSAVMRDKSKVGG